MASTATANHRNSAPVASAASMTSMLAATKPQPACSIRARERTKSSAKSLIPELIGIPHRLIEPKTPQAPAVQTREPQPGLARTSRLLGGNGSRAKSL
jgi:hypothetical protein